MYSILYWMAGYNPEPSWEWHLSDIFLMCAQQAVRLAAELYCIHYSHHTSDNPEAVKKIYGIIPGPGLRDL